MGISNFGYVAIALIAIAAVVLALRSNMRVPKKSSTAEAKTRRSSEQPTSSKRNPYRATAIVGLNNVCAAVREIGHKRFLVSDNDIPQLPLLNCDMPKCACKYTHYEDRRDADGDRRGPVGLHSELHRYFGQVEQRIKRGRRVADWA